MTNHSFISFHTTFITDHPVVKLIENSTTRNYTLLPPFNNEASVHILSQNVTLQTELFGRWQKQIGTEMASFVVFPLFTSDLVGVYKFYVTSWNGTEVLAIQIKISAVGKWHITKVITHL